MIGGRPLAGDLAVAEHAHHEQPGEVRNRELRFQASVNQAMPPIAANQQQPTRGQYHPS